MKLVCFLICSSLSLCQAIPLRSRKRAPSEEFSKHGSANTAVAVYQRDAAAPNIDDEITSPESRDQREMQSLLVKRDSNSSSNESAIDNFTTANATSEPTTDINHSTTFEPTTTDINATSEPMENGTTSEPTTDVNTTNEPMENSTTSEPTTTDIHTTSEPMENSTTSEPITTDIHTTSEPMENSTANEPTTHTHTNTTTYGPTTIHTNTTTYGPTTTTTYEPTASHTKTTTTYEPTTTGSSNSPTKRPRWLIPVVTVVSVVFLCVVVLIIVVTCCYCYKRHRKRSSNDYDPFDRDGAKKLQDFAEIPPPKMAKGRHRRKKQKQEDQDNEGQPIEPVLQPDSEPEEEPEEPEDQDDYARGVREFLNKHPEYTVHGTPKPLDLGSRMQKYWYKTESKDDNHQEKLLTIAPLSQNCPLQLHKHQKGLNKLLGAIKVHPFVHSIEHVEYLVDHQLLVMVQPLIHSGSLKDMIYKTTPMTDWSRKYSRRSKGLTHEKVARYGRQILEGLKFLYSKGLPVLGHVQTGNIFVVDDVCHLGGYENTLLGYRTRLYRLCKDHPHEHFDIILFGHVVFEMAAGYELTRVRPEGGEFKTVDKKVRPILEYIFEKGFPHDISEIASHEFFKDSLLELSGFDPDEVQLSDSMTNVLEKVHKGKPRVQKKSPKATTSSPGADEGDSNFWSGMKERLPKLPKIKWQPKLKVKRPKIKLGRSKVKAKGLDSDEARKPLLDDDAEDS